MELESLIHPCNRKKQEGESITFFKEKDTTCGRYLPRRYSQRTSYRCKYPFVRLGRLIYQSVLINTLINVLNNTKNKRVKTIAHKFTKTHTKTYVNNH